MGERRRPVSVKWSAAELEFIGDAARAFQRQTNALKLSGKLRRTAAGIEAVPSFGQFVRLAALEKAERLLQRRLPDPAGAEEAEPLQVDLEAEIERRRPTELAALAERKDETGRLARERLATIRAETTAALPPPRMCGAPDPRGGTPCRQPPGHQGPHANGQHLWSPPPPRMCGAPPAAIGGKPCTFKHGHAGAHEWQAKRRRTLHSGLDHHGKCAAEGCPGEALFRADLLKALCAKHARAARSRARGA